MVDGIEYTEQHSDIRDRSDWGSGPWDNEPDKLVWVDKETGLDCLIVRNTMGALCGYVGVPKGHKRFRTHYDSNYDLDCHGGLTYSDECQHDICHLSDEGEHLWWLGFDCAHSGDYVPINAVLGMGFRAHSYKNMAYVTQEVQKLARQIHETT